MILTASTTSSQQPMTEMPSTPFVLISDTSTEDPPNGNLVTEKTTTKKKGFIRHLLSLAPNKHRSSSTEAVVLSSDSRTPTPDSDYCQQTDNIPFQRSVSEIDLSSSARPVRSQSAIDLTGLQGDGSVSGDVPITKKSHRTSALLKRLKWTKSGKGGILGSRNWGETMSIDDTGSEDSGVPLSTDGGEMTGRFADDILSFSENNVTPVESVGEPPDVSSYSTTTDPSISNLCSISECAIDEEKHRKLSLRPNLFRKQLRRRLVSRGSSKSLSDDIDSLTPNSGANANPLFVWDEHDASDAEAVPSPRRRRWDWEQGSVTSSSSGDIAQKNSDGKLSKLGSRVQKYFQRGAKLAEVQRRLKSQIWSCVVTVVLVEGRNLLPMDLDGSSDPYVKFRLGNEKYKSRVAFKTLSPSWLEQFDLHLYDEGSHELEVTVWDRDARTKDDFMGRCTVDLTQLEREKTHRLWTELEDNAGSLFLLLTISGTTAAETISDLASYAPDPRETQNLYARYGLLRPGPSFLKGAGIPSPLSTLRSFHNLRDVGHLTVKVFRAQGLVAADIGGKSDPFCVLELVNARLQTQTEYKTLTPNWQKIFTFNVKDINSVLEVTVYDEDRDHKVEFLGRIAIPLLKIHNGEKRWYALKDKKLWGRAKGNCPQILMEMSLVWNPIRACIRTVNPKEEKYMQTEIKFKRQVFLRNVLRVKAVIFSVIDTGKFVQSCFEWESTARSLTAFAVFLVMCYCFEPYMLPVALLLIFMKNYLVLAITGGRQHREEEETLASEEEDDDDDKDKEEKKSLKDRLQAIQEVTQTVQNTIGYIASLCESVANTFNFTVPFLSWLAVVAMVMVAFLLYLMPVRYLVMLWGANKFMRKLVFPHTVPNNEILDFISRVPDDEQLIMYRELKTLQTPESSERRRDQQQRKKKT